MRQDKGRKTRLVDTRHGEEVSILTKSGQNCGTNQAIYNAIDYGYKY